MTASPRHLSPRRPGTTSTGRRIAALAAAFRRPFIPWQHDAADLIAERGSDGLYTRDLTVMTVQRQTGKTELIKFVTLDRCLFLPSARVWYTAQSGQYARDKWAEIADLVCTKGSPLAGYVAARWSKGDECLTFPNGSTLRPFPPTRDALHSKQADLIVIDEAWKHDPVRGAEILQAASPTMATRPGAQLILTSTMGTAASTWWHSWVDRGRAGDPAVSAMIEYGIGDDGDPDDLDAVIAAHPGVGHLTTERFIRQEYGKLSRNEFARAYGNARTAADERYIDPELWGRAATDEAPPTDRPLVLAAAVAADRSRTAILAAAGGIAEVIASQPGTGWAAARILDLRDRWHPAAVGVHRVGPSGTLYDELATAGVDLADIKAADYAAGCLSLMDKLADGRIRYRRHRALDDAADAAVPAPTGDGAWRWGRRLSGGPICEIEALTIAAWLDGHRPAARPRPRIRTGTT